MKRYRLLFVVFSFLSTTLVAQYIDDTRVKQYKKEVIAFLIQKNKFSESECVENISNMIYVRELYSNQKNIFIYEITPTSSHSLKYFSIIRDKNIFLFDSVDLNNDFNLIITKLDRLNIPSNKLLKLMQDISLIYQYNRKIYDVGRIINSKATY
ncbi:hypothetical protein FO675_00055 [Riemerella anatipestifer]|uniref:hypothetical protein n=1 Tax=Riemerella anatipestifer TaxID=34085 RepID=UPI001AD7C5CE|nr:hypothetical protein [Riemerella anatipestifer]MBO4232712.1 hypothetical protein [Riemerella anatipestifer]MDY3344207.1 hypothetical protein [Riemerella anatipestifer]MDY3357287.1 hypothetical protein [Riemerella anatipestifer]